LQSGYESLGKGIGAGIQAVGQAYGDYKKMSSEIKSSEGFYNSLKEGKYLPEGMITQIDNTINSDAFKHSSTQDKAAYWNNLRSFSGQSIANKWAMDRLDAQLAVEKNKPYYQAGGQAILQATQNPNNPQKQLGHGGGVIKEYSNSPEMIVGEDYTSLFQ
jgi:hypothetical protein